MSSNDIIISNDRDTQIPTSHSGLSSYDTEITGGSHIRTHTMEMIPQLDGPTSVCSRRRILENVGTEQETIQRPTVIPRGEYPDESDSNSHDNRRPHDGRRPSGRRRYHDRSGRPPDRGNNHDRGHSRRGRPPDGNGGPPDGNGGPPDDGRPSDGGGPPDDGGPPRNGQNPRHPGRRGPPGPPGPPGPVRPVIVQQPQVSLDLDIWNSWPVYVTIG